MVISMVLNLVESSESIDFKGNLKQGYAAINSVTKIELSKNIYRDIKLEFSYLSTHLLKTVLKNNS